MYRTIEFNFFAELEVTGKLLKKLKAKPRRKILKFHSFLPPIPSSCKGEGGPRFQTRDVNGGKFFLKFEKGEQKRGIQYFVVVQWGELVWSLVNFSLSSSKNNLSRPSLYRTYILLQLLSWLIMWSTFFISFLLLFSSTTSSGFHPIFIIMENCEHTFEK